MTEENKKKRDYLKEYRKHADRIRRIEEEIVEIRSMKISPSLRNDGMPRAKRQNDLSGYASKLDELERGLKKEREERLFIYEDIAHRISTLSEEPEKDVLFYRYIRGLDWWEIAETMQYSERQVLRFHGRALSKLQLNKDVSECQR